eukprot:6214017-Pleurochrysis_carterae.AAC.2
MKLVVPAPLLVVLARRRLAVHRRQHRQVRRREDDKQVVGLDLVASPQKGRVLGWTPAVLPDTICRVHIHAL